MIFDIQSYSVHDGPGCRTNVFFVGCPLQCRWCANPESWAVKKHLLFAERSCKWDQGCTACRDACPNGSLKFNDQGKPCVDWAICNKCETIECSEVCAAHALKQCVRFLTVDDLMKILMRDFPNWGSNGGVTFSGGEPLLHHEFLDQVLQRCRKDFRCARGHSVYQYRHRQITMRGVGIIFLPVALTVLGINNASFAQQFVRDFHNVIQQTAGIIAHIHNQSLRAALRKALQGLPEPFYRIATELENADIADMIAHHAECDIVHRDLARRDIKIQRFFATPYRNAYLFA